MTVVKKRKVELKRKDEWIEVDPIVLHKDDIFRMYEPDGKLVSDSKGNSELVAASDAYIIPEYLPLEIVGIQTEA